MPEAIARPLLLLVVMKARGYVFSFVASVLVAQPDGSHARGSGRAATDPSLLIDDASTMMRLEGAGFALADVLRPGMVGFLRETVAGDMNEIGAGLPRNSPKRRFDPTWISR